MATIVTTPAGLNALNSSLNADAELGANISLIGYGSQFQAFDLSEVFVEGNLVAGSEVTGATSTASGIIYSISSNHVFVLLDEGSVPFVDGEVIEEDATETQTVFSEGTYNGVPHYSWRPIGMTATGQAAYTGNFDGKGFSITDLAIYMVNRNAVALFSQVGSNILNLKVSGTIIAPSCSYIGMIRGYTTTSEGEYVGKCVTSGTITATGGNQIGGIAATIGTVAGDVRDCYSTVAITGNADIGGIYGKRFTSGTVARCHASGALVGNSNVGGIGGSSSAGAEVNCFYDTEKTGVAVSSGGATGLTSAQMKVQTLFSGWDFGTIWKMAIDYPVLKVFSTDKIGERFSRSIISRLNMRARFVRF